MLLLIAKIITGSIIIMGIISFTVVIIKDFKIRKNLYKYKT